ncbi:MAG: hypothetical protein ACRDD1_03920, partial [Planctomycetia bacterium]
MSEARLDLRSLDFTQLFPWVSVLRAFRLALDPKKIALGAFGALLTTLGWTVIASLLMGSAPVKPEPAAGTDLAAVTAHNEQLRQYQASSTYYQTLAAVRRPIWESSGPGDPFTSPLQTGGWRNGLLPNSFYLVFQPIHQLATPATVMLQSTSASFAGLLLTLWTLAVWAFVGGAITRIAAVQFARDSQVSLAEASRFAAQRYFSYFGAPVLPFAAIVVVGLFCVVGGFLSRIPAFDILMGLVWVFALMGGFVMAVLAAGLILGWPLMYATISTEATESYDALSRSYSYVLGRPWRYLWYTTVAAVAGGVASIVVLSFGYATVDLSQYAVSWGGGEENLRAFYAYAPTAGGWRESFGPTVVDGAVTLEPTGTRRYTALLIGLWTHALFLGIVGFAYSYFWSAATIIYFLLRRDVDETDFDEVALDEEQEEPFPMLRPTAAPIDPTPDAGPQLVTLSPPPTDSKPDPTSLTPKVDLSAPL